MDRVTPVAPEELPEDLKGIYEFSLDNMGFEARDVLTMAHKPELLKAMSALVGAVYGPGEIEEGFKHLMAEITSQAAGCMYCTAHTAHGAAKAGVSQDRIDALWAFEDSELFSAAEKAALNFAMLAGHSPSAVQDEDFLRLKAHYTDAEIVEIMGVIGLFGFLNRWNDSLATRLEGAPKSFAEAHLSPEKWSVGKHE